MPFILTDKKGKITALYSCQQLNKKGKSLKLKYLDKEDDKIKKYYQDIADEEQKQKIKLSLNQIYLNYLIEKEIGIETHMTKSELRNLYLKNKV